MKNLIDETRPLSSGVDWFGNLPHHVAELIDGRLIVAAGFGAGPSFVAQKYEEFVPPISVEAGAQWLNRWQDTFKRARLVFEGGVTLSFDKGGFVGAA